MKAIAPILPGPSHLPVLPAALTAPLRLAADFAQASKAPARDFCAAGHRCGAVLLPG
jgi:hypothetical protein